MIIIVEREREFNQLCREILSWIKAITGPNETPSELGTKNAATGVMV